MAKSDGPLLPMYSFVRAVHPVKGLLPPSFEIDIILVIVSVVNEEQPLNALGKILVNNGNIDAVRPVQPLNPDTSIVVTFGNFELILVILVQPANAPSLITVTCGKLNVDSEEQPLNT